MIDNLPNSQSDYSTLDFMSHVFAVCFCAMFFEKSVPSFTQFLSDFSRFLSISVAVDARRLGSVGCPRL